MQRVYKNFSEVAKLIERLVNSTQTTRNHKRAQILIFRIRYLACNCVNKYKYSNTNRWIGKTICVVYKHLYHVGIKYYMATKFVIPKKINCKFLSQFIESEIVSYKNIEYSTNTKEFQQFLIRQSFFRCRKLGFKFIKVREYHFTHLLHIRMLPNLSLSVQILRPKI